MKNLILLLLLVSPMAFGQGNQLLDTIYANESNNISLFFPSHIRQGITGAPNFTFSFNEDNAQYFGLLKAAPGKESNLLVLTMDGQIYSYILKYREKVSKLNYFLSQEESIGNEVPPIKVSESLMSDKEGLDISKEADSLVRRTAYLEKLSEFYLRTSKDNIKTRRKKGLKLRVKDIIYYKNDTFMVFELENRSGIDFQLNYLNVYLSKGNRRRNASYQKLLMPPVFSYGFPEVVKHREKKKFVYVLPKFTVGENEKIEVEVREKRGNRYLKLWFN